MPRYSSFGQLDDQLIDDADLGFVNMNNRLRPDQLKAGVLADSRNGRMGINGEWQTRKGINVLSAPVAAGGSAVTLPFYILQKSVSTASRSGNTVTVNFSSAHGFTDQSVVYFSGFTGYGANQNPDGNRTITVVDSDTVTFSMTGTDNVASYTGTKSAGAPVLDDTTVNVIYGSCLYSNPNDLSSAYIILASNTKAIAVSLISPYATTDISYPGAETISANVSLLQAFNKVFIFREGDEALEWNGVLTGSPAFTLVPSGDYTQPALITSIANTTILNGKATVAATAHGLVTGDAITVIDGKNIIANDTVVVVAGYDTNSFYYYITENHATAPAVISTATRVNGGTVTITTSADHGYATGDYLKISGINYTAGEPNPNGTFKIIVVDTTHFTYTIGSSNSSISAGTNATAVYAASMQYMQKQSVGLGFCYMPAPPWAVYHQRRLWMPFYYTQSGTNGNATYVSRGIRDELIVSDILDSNTYDQVYNEYRFNAGTSDYIVTLHPFSDDKLVVFNRNSIHLVISSADVTQSSIQLITNEVGCLARKSVVQVADNILFLSDNGIYGANFPNLYNLRGNGVPLSDGIQATINRINKDYAQNAVAAYYDNRYYIAVPLDSSSTNNAILVYNFLNQGWESIDTVRINDKTIDPNWEVTDLYVGGNGANRGLYAVNKNGGIHRLDYNENGRDLVITQIGQITASDLYVRSACTTRMFTYGVTDRKRFNNFELQLQSSTQNVSDVAITAEGENIDSTMNLGSVSSRLSGDLAIDEDASIRGRIGQNRSYGLQFTLTPTQGRPRIRTIKVSASITNRALTSTK